MMSTSIPKTQKAVMVQELGKPVVLVNDRPIPRPKEDEVLIKVSVTSLNPHDQKTRDQGLLIKVVKEGPLPALITHDVVGNVVALGPGVKKYTVGNRIVTQGRFTPDWHYNGSQEYALVNVMESCKIPEVLSDDEAATLPTNIAAPLIGLFECLKIPAPWTNAAKDFDYAATSLLIIGGGAACGKFAVQLAGLAGIGKVVVVGGKEAELKKWGATHVIDRHGGYEFILKQIYDVVGDDLLYAFDAINKPADQHLGVNALSNSKKGSLARLLPRAGVDESKVLPKEAGFEVVNVFGSTQDRDELGKQFWDLLPRWLEEKKIVPTEFEVKKGLTADNFNDVMDRYRDGQKVVKTNIHV